MALLLFASAQVFAFLVVWRRRIFSSVEVPEVYVPPSTPTAPVLPKQPAAPKVRPTAPPAAFGQGRGQVVAVPRDLAVLVVASGRDASRLRATLTALVNSVGVQPRSILVSQAAQGEASRKLCDELGVLWAGPSTMTLAVYDGEAPPWIHYGRSLERAATFHFTSADFQMLLVVEEDLVFSPDFGGFVGQLTPLLMQDDTLWCISAWNDNGLAPYSSDLSSVLRTEWFSGVAWIVALESVRQDLLFAWQDRERMSWQAMIRARKLQSKQDCLVPEVSRVAFAGYQCDGAGVRGQCGDEEVATRSSTPRSVFSAATATDLGDVGRLMADRYPELLFRAWPRQQGVASAVRVDSVEDLEALMLPNRDESATTPPLLLAVSEEVTASQKDPWAPVLEFFGLSPGSRGPRCTWRGILRLPWRDTTLYIVGSNNSMLRDLTRTPSVLHSSAFALLPGSGAHRTTGAQPPQPLPPWSSASVSAGGQSCSMHCAGRGEFCVDADLAVVARCGPPLTDLLPCALRCEDKATSAAYPGEDSSSRCFAGAPLPGLRGSHHGRCDASAAGVQRLCVCRRHGKVPLRIQSASQHFGALRDSDRKPGQAFKATGPKPAPHRFGGPLTSGAGLKVSPGKLHVLVVADAALRSTPDDMTKLHSTLSSLSAAAAFTPGMVLLVHADGKLATVQLAETFGIQRLEVSVDRKIKLPSDRTSALYKAALTEPLKSFAASASSVLVLGEGAQVSTDVLWFFAQLEPVLLSDDSLMAVCGWNDAALAPFSADPTVVLRSDWFPGAGFMLTRHMIQELMSMWRAGFPFQRLLRDRRPRKGRQFLVPEVSRVVPDPQLVVGTVQGTMSAQQRVSPKGQLQPYYFVQNPLCSFSVVDLGDVGRLEEKRYKRLFLVDWPGEGLLRTKILSSLQTLLEGKVTTGGPFRMVYRSLESSETDPSWRALAHFFGLWPEPPSRPAYHGVVRLPWRDTVLFLVPSSTSLAGGEVREEVLSESEDAKLDPLLPPLASQIIDPILFTVASRPLLAAPGAEIVAAELAGTSCASFCYERGLTCLAEDLPFVNSCDALSAIMGCRICEPGEGSDQPAQEVYTTRSGRCLHNTNLGQYPLTCDASHPDTRRLCVCRSILLPAEGPVEAPAPEQTTPAATTKTVTKPRAAVLAKMDESVPVVVIASSSRPHYLERCLSSLADAEGFDPALTLVSQDGDGKRVRDLVKENRVLGHQVDTGDKPAGVKLALHYAQALQHAIEGPFKNYPAIAVLEEDVVVSADFLLFFQQLRELLLLDTTLFCVGAWSDAARGPFAARRARLLRVDTFPGAAWMFGAERLLRDYLPRWPRNSFDKHLRKHAGRQGRQCLIPEVARARRASDGAVDGRSPRLSTQHSGAVFVESREDELAHADLGPVLQKMLPEVYEEQFTRQLQRATLVEELAALPTPLMLQEDTEGSLLAGASGWRVHYLSDNAETDGVWRYVARFLQLPETSHPPCMLDGVTRLPWGPGYLFLVTSTSSMAIKARLRPLPAEPLLPEAFQEAKQPVLIPPFAMTQAAERSGQSCTDFCASKGGSCSSADLLFVNRCEALRHFMYCERCEKNHGSDQPALASRRSSGSYGACLFNGDLLRDPISCDAAHKDTKRLCVCRRPEEDLPDEALAADTTAPELSTTAGPTPASSEAPTTERSITDALATTPVPRNSSNRLKVARKNATEPAATTKVLPAHAQKSQTSSRLSTVPASGVTVPDSASRTTVSPATGTAAHNASTTRPGGRGVRGALRGEKAKA